MTTNEYNECVDRYADAVYRFILKNMRIEADAQDVVQTAFEKLWINREQVDPAKSKAYLFTIAYHQMIDLLRKNKRILLQEGFPEEAKFKEQPAMGIRKTLDVALSRLNATSRSLVLLKDYEGYSYQEIGAITGLSESQVKVYLHRARIELKNYLIKVEHVL